MNGYCSECGKYGQLLAKLANGTEIYRCYDCGRVWGERLVIFEVTYTLSEHKAQNEPAEAKPVAVSVMAEA